MTAFAGQALIDSNIRILYPLVWGCFFVLGFAASLALAARHGMDRDLDRARVRGRSASLSFGNTNVSECPSYDGDDGVYNSAEASTQEAHQNLLNHSFS